MTFEDFPWRTVLACNAVGLSIYAIGLCLMSRLGTAWGMLYAAYCLWMEWRVLSGSCRSCCYFGKRCGFGKGRLSSLLFGKGTGQKLSEKQISWKDLAPDFMVSLVPLAAGSLILTRDFS